MNTATLSTRMIIVRDSLLTKTNKTDTQQNYDATKVLLADRGVRYSKIIDIEKKKLGLLQTVNDESASNKLWGGWIVVIAHTLSRRPRTADESWRQ